MAEGYTVCDDCLHVMRDGPSYRWTCHECARKEGFGFVTRKLWEKDAPFMYCRDINGGACKMFERKEKENGKDGTE